MKGKRLAVLCAALTMAMSGCGIIKDAGSRANSAKDQRTAEVQQRADKEKEYRGETESSEGGGENSEDVGESSAEGKKRPAHEEIGHNGAKAVTDVLLIPDEDIDISRAVRFSDLYGRHVLHSGVVGLVGAPVEVDFDSDEVKGGKLVFVYDPAELKGVRPDALMFMWYDEENDNYLEMEDGVLNTDNCSMNLEIAEPGVYLLVNKYQWLNVWGAELDDNGLEKGYDPYSQPISSEVWEMNEITGDILELKDDEYISSCRQEDGSYIFKVSTPEQLASAVFVNNCAEPRSAISIELTGDIDLAGYEWAPMGWYTAGIDFPFMGVFNGNGHTIRNMKITGGYYIGLVGYSDCCQICDLNVEDAYVDGRNPGIIAGYLRCGSIVKNCHVSGEVIGSEGGPISSLQQTSDIIDCTADVTVNGEDPGEFLSGDKMEASKVAALNEPTEKLWLDDNGIPTREGGIEDKYRNLGWEIKRDGEVVLNRNAEGEFSPGTNIINEPGHYEVTLTAFVDGYYIPISNTVEFDR